MIDQYNELQGNNFEQQQAEQLTKFCPRCKNEKNINQFYKNNKGEISSYCRACNSNYNMIMSDKRKKYSATSHYGTNVSNKNIKLLVIEHYSNGKNCCACCGESHIEFLSIDHVNGGGSKHLKKIGLKIGGSHLYRYLFRNDFPNDPPLQILCLNCNSGARMKDGCPHKRKKDEVIPID